LGVGELVEYYVDRLGEGLVIGLSGDGIFSGSGRRNIKNGFTVVVGKRLNGLLREGGGGR